MTKITFCLLILGLAACAASQPRPVKMVVTHPAPETPASTLPELLKQIETAYRRGNYAFGLDLVKKALELEKNNVSAMDRIGSIYFVLGRYGEAVTIWSRALPLEKDLAKRRALENSIAVSRRSLGLLDATPAVVPAPAAKTPPAGQDEIQTLQKKGIKHYASGEYLQAATVFLRILELDPENADATKALKRLQLQP